jgi:hypothetical protein
VATLAERDVAREDAVEQQQPGGGRGPGVALRRGPGPAREIEARQVQDALGQREIGGRDRRGERRLDGEQGDVVEDRRGDGAGGGARLVLRVGLERQRHDRQRGSWDR